MKKKAASLMLVVAVFASCLSACSSRSDKDQMIVSPETIVSAASAATSVEASVSINLQARVGTSVGSSGHNTSLESDITVKSTNDPFAYHGEYYSNILVDGVSTREDKEYYVVKDGTKYIRYEYTDATEEWTKSTLSRADVMALPLKTCAIQNWDEFMSHLSLKDDDPVTLSNKSAYEYVGEIPAVFLQEVLGDRVFGSFMYNVEQLLNDNIECKAYFDAETALPIKIELDFTDSFLVNDMNIDNGIITVTYKNWNEIDSIELPKKISIVASDDTAKFYSTYYAWNLFLPYLNNSNSKPGTAGNSGLSFSTSWETYQLRIDQGMTSLPLTYESLNNLGYNIDKSYASNILEPNNVIHNVPVLKGKDQFYCSFYNPETTPKPIIECSIGCIDVKAANIVNNGISVFLPGEITLGVSRAALESAYGKPDQKSEGFSADTYTWDGDAEGQSFMAEISPATDQVIRIRLENLPIVSNGSEAEVSTAETVPETVAEPVTEEQMTE